MSDTKKDFLTFYLEACERIANQDALIKNRYQPRISEDSAGSFYALIVRVDYDGYEEVIYGYKGRHFKTLKAATKSTTNYIAKHNLNDNPLYK